VAPEKGPGRIAVYGEELSGEDAPGIGKKSSRTSANAGIRRAALIGASIGTPAFFPRALGSFSVIPDRAAAVGALLCLFKKERTAVRALQKNLLRI